MLAQGFMVDGGGYFWVGLGEGKGEFGAVSHIGILTRVGLWGVKCGV